VLSQGGGQIGQTDGLGPDRCPVKVSDGGLNQKDFHKVWCQDLVNCELSIVDKKNENS